MGQVHFPGLPFGCPGIAELTLRADNGDVRTLRYRARSTPAGRHWFAEVQNTTRAQLPIKDAWRVYNAPGCRNAAELSWDFERCVETINSYRPGTVPSGNLPRSVNGALRR